MNLTKRQREIKRALIWGSKVWTVSHGDLDEDPNAKAVLAHFSRGDFLGTEPIQLRTLYIMRAKGVIEFEGDDWNTTSLTTKGGTKHG